jgi:hypothetical protein
VEIADLDAYRADPDRAQRRSLQFRDRRAAELHEEVIYLRAELDRMASLLGRLRAALQKAEDG